MSSLTVEASLQGSEGLRMGSARLDDRPKSPSGRHFPSEQQPRPERDARPAKRGDLGSAGTVGEAPLALACPFNACDGPLPPAQHYQAKRVPCQGSGCDRKRYAKYVEGSRRSGERDRQQRSENCQPQAKRSRRIEINPQGGRSAR